MATENQIAANRANAKRSTGPRTAPGKAKSARNSIRHGLLAKALVLDEEAGQCFEQLLESYIQHFKPSDPVQAALVETMVTARWRQFRALNYQTALIKSEIEDLIHVPDDPTARAALAFRHLADESRSLQLLDRYESAYERDFHRALLRLEKLKLRNEPN